MKDADGRFYSLATLDRPQFSAMKFWISSFQNIVQMESLTAKLNKAQQSTVRNWANLYDSIQEL